VNTNQELTGSKGFDRECIKTHHFDIRNTKIFWRGSTAPDPTPSVPSMLNLRCPFQMDWKLALVKS